MTLPRRKPIPRLELLLAYGPALLILAAGIGGFALPADLQRAAVTGGWLWATAILLFLAGVTRGLSFFSPGGPHAMQIAQMAWLFAAGLGAIVSPPTIAFVLLTLGYASIALFDPPAARRCLAPARFARLRPRQMAVVIAGLVLLLLRAMEG